MNGTPGTRSPGGTSTAEASAQPSKAPTPIATGVATPTSITSKGKQSTKSGKSKKIKTSILDLFSDDAMENAYYICHNVPDFFMCRGYKWPALGKK